MRIGLIVFCILAIVAEQPVFAQSDSVLRIQIEFASQQPNADLQITQQVIEHRMQALGLPNHQVELIEEWLVVSTQAPMSFDEALILSQKLMAILQPVALLEFVDLSSLPSSTMASDWVGACVVTTAQVARHIVHEDCRTQPDKQPFPTIITGQDLTNVETAQVPHGEWLLNFLIADDEAAARLEEHTATHIGSAMAIVLDGEILLAPTIQAGIGREGVITGNFTQIEAHQLSIQLQSGALPVALDVHSIIIHRVQ